MHTTSPSARTRSWPAVLALILLLTACGGGTATTTAPGNVSGTAPTTAVAAAPTTTATTAPPGGNSTAANSGAATAFASPSANIGTATVAASPSRVGTATGSATAAASPIAATPVAGPPHQQALKVPSRQGQAELTEERTLTLPAGFAINVFQSGLGSARLMVWSPEGALVVSEEGSPGRVSILTDPNGDGVADSRTTFAEGLNTPHGLAFHEGYLYVATVDQVLRYRWQGGAAAQGKPETIVDGIPTGGHSTRTIVFGPDGKLYLSVGSSCNVCQETDAHRAAIWQYNADGSGGRLYARGLRNAVGLAWQPGTDNLYATNNGRDGLGDDTPPETVNLVRDGDDFGGPYCHAGRIPDPQFGQLGNCAQTAKPAIEMQAHSAPLGLAFYTGGMFPADYTGDLFIAFHGSWNRSTKTGYKVVRARFQNGQPTGQVEDFVTGWLSPNADSSWGRPVGVLVGPDGALYISDDALGVIYRVTYAGR